jgi:phosphate transport system substrate-binding protein
VPVDDGKADNGEGPLSPSAETVRSGTYQPLSRPLFIYVSRKAADRPEIQQFVDAYFFRLSASANPNIGFLHILLLVYTGSLFNIYNHKVSRIVWRAYDVLNFSFWCV